MFNFGYLGVAASLALAAFGSAMGIGAAAQSAIGAWKKSYQQNKPAPFMLVVYCGFPLSQTLYGFVLILASLLPNIATVDPWFILGAGVFGGIGMGASAYAQGKAAACACDRAAFARYFSAMLDAGEYVAPSQFEAMFLSAAHTNDDVEQFLDAAKATIETEGF